MMKRKRLRRKIWLYLIGFSIAIFIFLWFFQVVFFNRYYEWSKTRKIKQIAHTILNMDSQAIDRLAYQENIYVEMTTASLATLYTSNYSFGYQNQVIEQHFITSGRSSYTYTFTHPKFEDKSITYALKNGDIYIFVSTSIEPLHSFVAILQEQLAIISIFVLGLSFVLAYFISRRISNPIVAISIAASKIAKGKMNTVFECNSDIVELVELTDSLNEMKIELAKTDELRKDLMANISHDLKTPLTMIKAYAEMILDIHLHDPDKICENLDTILVEADRMNLLVSDILTLSKMEANMDSLTIEEFDLIPFMKAIVKRFSIFGEKDGYTILFESCFSTLLVKADKKKLEQVIYNFVANAIHYTGKDKTVIVAVKEQENGYLVSFHNSGEKLDEEDKKKIFDRYYRNRKNHKRQIYGTGLGLCIVKSILELHHYSYGVLDEEMDGTTFYFILPKAN